MVKEGREGVIMVIDLPFVLREPATMKRMPGVVAERILGGGRKKGRKRNAQVFYRRLGAQSLVLINP